jgi:general secretion pathway protein D
LPKGLQDNNQPLAKRNIKTTLVIKNQDTAVLGGLMKDKETEQVSKVPLLGDLPIIGWLFKGRSVSTEKVNLLVFLTPKIVRNPADQKSIIDRKLDERLKYIKAQGGRDPYGETVDRLGNKTSKVIDDNE